MNGFFELKDIQSQSHPNGKRFSCVSCGLYHSARSPKMEPSGLFKKKILNIGSIPNEIEDQFNCHWEGSSSEGLKRIYKKLGIDIYEDCLNINAINCYPGDNKIDISKQIACCRNIVLQTIKQYKPQVIVLFGIEAVQSIIGSQWKKKLGDLKQWRGWTIPDLNFNAWICPVFHPRQMEQVNKEIGTVWYQDLERAVSKVGVNLPHYQNPKIEIIEDLSVLYSLRSTNAFDYETTGIRPYATGHRIVCVSIADTIDHAYVFMMPQTKEGRKPFIDFLENQEIGKMAHNMKYEDTWSKIRLHTSVKNWKWDSMVAAHILDNRELITGLKFQAYVNLGVADYDSEIAPYLHSAEKNGNAINRIMELIELPGGKEKLMTYCALDSIYEFRLASIQMEKIGILPF